LIPIKSKPYDIVRKAKESLKSGVMNLLIAKSMIERVRREKVDKVLIQTSIIGMPIPSRAIADMYIRAGLGYVSKTLKLILKLETICERKLQPYTLLIHDKLRDVIDILKSITISEEFTSEDIDRIIAKIEKALMKLEEVEWIINSYSSPL